MAQLFDDAIYGLLDVARIWYHDSGFTLDGLDHERASLRVLEQLLQRSQVVVGNNIKSETTERRNAISHT